MELKTFISTAIAGAIIGTVLGVWSSTPQDNIIRWAVTNFRAWIGIRRAIQLGMIDEVDASLVIWSATAVLEEEAVRRAPLHHPGVWLRQSRNGWTSLRECLGEELFQRIEKELRADVGAYGRLLTTNQFSEVLNRLVLKHEADLKRESLARPGGFRE